MDNPAVGKWFMTNRSHRDSRKDERIRLQAALELNQPLAMAYYMK